MMPPISPGGTGPAPTPFPSMKRRLLFVLAAVAVAACSDANKNAKEGGFRVALLSPGPVNDNGWNASAYAGLMRIQQELGAEVAQQQVATPVEFEDGFRRNAERGAKLVFGHGFE